MATGSTTLGSAATSSIFRLSGSRAVAMNFFGSSNTSVLLLLHEPEKRVARRMRKAGFPALLRILATSGLIRVGDIHVKDTRENFMVPKGGLEPPRVAPPPPQDGVSASSTTSALGR